MNLETLSKSELIDELKRREERISGLEAEIASAREQLDDIINSNPGVIYTCRAEGDFGATFISDNLRKQFGYEPREFTETPSFWSDHIHPDDKARVFKDLEIVFTRGHHEHEYRFKKKSGDYVWVRDELRLLRHPDGRPKEITGYWIDIDARKKAEEESAKLNERLARQLQAQSRAILELSTPVIPIWEEILVLPLIGTVDTTRAQQILDNLLEAVAKTKAEVVIMDITGVPVVDTKVAQHFLRAIQATRILGAETVLTGVSPYNAQTLVKLGVDLTNIITRGTLRDGLKLAFARTRNTVTKAKEF